MCVHSCCMEGNHWDNFWSCIFFFFAFWALTHTLSHVWTECSLCTFKTRPASSYYTLKQLSDWQDTDKTPSLYMGFFITNTTRYTKQLQYVSVLSQMVYSNDVAPMMFCYILFHNIIKWILWIYDDFSHRRRIDAHWLLTPVPCFFLLLFLSDLCV